MKASRKDRWKRYNTTEENIHDKKKIKRTDKTDKHRLDKSKDECCNNTISQSFQTRSVFQNETLWLTRTSKNDGCSSMIRYDLYGINLSYQYAAPMGDYYKG